MGKVYWLILPKKPGLLPDHKDRNGLNNTRENLRYATEAQNLQNRGMPKNNTSGYKGVMWCENKNKWRVQIKANNKRISLGYYSCIIKAAKAYNKAAIKYHGEFAVLNEIENVWF